MALTDILNITEVSASQSQKEVTINEALNALANSMNDSLVVLVADVTTLAITSADPDYFFDRHMVFDLTPDASPPSAAFTVELPASERLFVVRNKTLQDATIEVDPTSDGADGTTVTILAGESRILYSNGVDLEELGGGGSGGSSGPQTLTENAQTGTTYTAVLTDADDKFVSMANAAANTLTIPANATTAFDIGDILYVQQKGAGQTTIAAAGGVTINYPATASLALRDQWSWAQLVKTGTDEWALAGDLEAAPGSTADAADIAYDNGTSGLTADEVQAAIDEIVAGLGLASAETYEEGTWTPVMAFQTPGDSSWSYALSEGRYTRIGNVCHFDITISSANVTFTTASGYVYVSLPFTPAADLNTACVCMPISNFTWPTGTTQLLGLVSSAYPGLAILASGNGASQAAVGATQITSGVNRSWRFSGHFIIAP